MNSINFRYVLWIRNYLFQIPIRILPYENCPGKDPVRIQINTATEFNRKICEIIFYFWILFTFMMLRNASVLLCVVDRDPV